MADESAGGALQTRITELGKAALAALDSCTTPAGLDEAYQKYLGKKGELSAIMKGFGALSPEEKKSTGQVMHQTRTGVEEYFAARKLALEEEALAARLAREAYDALRPVADFRGHLHPISQLQMQVEEIFSNMGFRIMDGPEVETDENNFGRLNFSDDHPARDMQDTIWTADGNLMRTHTSTIQVRSMRKLKPPFRIIAPGRVFRYEETDATHENTFHQVEGMLIDRDVSVAHIIHIMKTFLSEIFEREIKVRLRPGYFPFVEPGFELDYLREDGRWLELMPCGMVHPNVLRAGGIDPTEWSGFAFGLGLDRLVMMRYGIEDIRHMLAGNLRFQRQF
jgi:phenylalanyl-tRNA synthetase alpha chain